jgi:protein gp37
MSDLFHEKVHFEQIAAVWSAMKMTPRHTYQILTKRPRRALEYFEWATMFGDSTLGNVHLGVSAENQRAADERIPLLLRCPAAVRWVSYEPLLGPVAGIPAGLDWVVVGCESGKSRRDCDVAWILRLIDECEDKGLPVFVKQIAIGSGEGRWSRVSKDPHEWDGVAKGLAVRMHPGERWKS